MSTLECLLRKIGLSWLLSDTFSSDDVKGFDTFVCDDESCYKKFPPHTNINHSKDFITSQQNKLLLYFVNIGTNEGVDYFLQETRFKEIVEQENGACFVMSGNKEKLDLFKERYQKEGKPKMKLQFVLEGERISGRINK